ncbi:recombinase family protein [Kaistella sp. PBT33-4]|uniref:recombinase family protein n=1 Tax=Kaistella sp. PBT33-4 TaxID=3032000 RepID=UPI0023D82AF9|nr:recombinase family protein [Kaistella sp. PBT33-4]MDF0720845.1 recombinase family protein [Kaistella sp. PBT33-4]
MLIGYARVSTQLQDNASQIEALRNIGCETIFEETISGGRWERPKLQELLHYVRKGDTIVVWKLDRLSRSLKDLLFIMEQIESRGAGFRSLTESIDTTTSAGKMMMQMVGVFAEFERSMLKERTIKGLEYAKGQGRVGGRRPKLKQIQVQEIVQLYAGGKSAVELAQLFNVHKATVYRVINSSKE